MHVQSEREQLFLASYLIALQFEFEATNKNVTDAQKNKHEIGDIVLGHISITDGTEKNSKRTRISSFLFELSALFLVTDNLS